MEIINQQEVSKQVFIDNKDIIVIFVLSIQR